MNLNPILCVTENDDVSEHNDEIINSIVKKMDAVDSNNSNNGDINTNNTEYVKKDNFKKIIGDIRVDILGILNVLGMINKNVIKENNDNKDLFKEIDDLKKQLKVLNETIKVPQVYNPDTVISLKKDPVIIQEPQIKVSIPVSTQNYTPIQTPSNIRISNQKEIHKTPNINNKNPHFVNNINTQRMTNNKIPLNIVNKNDKNVDKRR